MIFNIKYLFSGTFGHVLTDMEGKLEHNLSIYVGFREGKRGLCNLWMFKVFKIYGKFDDIF
jgi:hypothetical protein